MASDANRIVIVGAGPTGLSLAIELGSRNIPCLVVERNDRVGYAPRAKTTNVRTRTHLRRWGLAGRLARESPFGVHYPSDVVFVTRLAGAFLAKVENASNCAPERNALYPEHGQWVPQYKLEQVLREHVETLGSVKLRFSTEFVTAVQDESSVRVTVRDRATGREEALICEYLVGADGARSAVRDLIGASMQGEYGLSRNYNIVFRAPGLAQAHGHGPATMYWQTHPAAPSLIGPMDRDDVWFFMPTRLRDGFDISDEDAIDLIRDATGIDLPYEILSRDEWVASALIADRYRRGRIVLAGDACHLHPPFGGYGMNMGISDGVDLGWKLTALLRGWGGPRLLASYQAERRPVHDEVIGEARANHAILSNDFWRDGLEADTVEGEALRREMGARIVASKTREFHTLGTVLGTYYQNSPIILPDVEGRATRTSAEYTPSSEAGCLAPHLWREDGRSLYDLFGAGFTLVCRPDANPAPALAEALAAGIPLELVWLGTDEGDDLYPKHLTLVRPDQHVAWRGDLWKSDVLLRAAGWDVTGESADRAVATSGSVGR